MKYIPEDAMLQVLIGKTRGLTLKQMSSKLGFSYQYLSEVLTGKKPVTNGLARALGYTRVFIRSEDDNEA